MSVIVPLHLSSKFWTSFHLLYSYFIFMCSSSVKDGNGLDSAAKTKLCPFIFSRNLGSLKNRYIWISILLDNELSLIHVDCEQVRNNPDKFGDGMAPIYGAAATMPDRGSVRDLLIAYMDGTC